MQASLSASSITARSTFCGTRFLRIDTSLYLLLGFSNQWDAAILWPLQVFTHSFIHLNLHHVISNVTGVAILSGYERRVGSKRHLAVLMTGAMFSNLSILFYTAPTVASGISGGLFALLAAYFIDFPDHKQHKVKTSIWAVLLLITIITLATDLRMDSNQVLAYSVDHLGHIFGALGGLIYCRLRPL
jgi:membrane associated rhomboid family serine protease